MGTDNEPKWLTIRLSQAEHDALTRIRGQHELFSSERISIKDILSSLIIDAQVNFANGTLNMPQYRTVPELAQDEIIEQISLKKSPEETAALKMIGFTQRGVPLDYGQADMIRELIKIAHRDYVDPVLVKFKEV